jgi:hypothetical protein
MYERKYKLVCEAEPKMERFRIVTTQGLPFAQLMKNYSVKMPGFISATDVHYDNERWEITTVWESKKDFDEAQKHPMRKMFWTVEVYSLSFFTRYLASSLTPIQHFLSRLSDQ